jgi:hypothetical protein
LQPPNIFLPLNGRAAVLMRLRRAMDNGGGGLAPSLNV